LNNQKCNHPSEKPNIKNANQAITKMTLTKSSEPFLEEALVKYMNEATPAATMSPLGSNVSTPSLRKGGCS
jgi:hypothetical protein